MMLHRERNHTPLEKVVHALGFLVLAALMISVVLLRWAVLAGIYAFEQLSALAEAYLNTDRNHTTDQPKRMEPPR